MVIAANLASILSAEMKAGQFNCYAFHGNLKAKVVCVILTIVFLHACYSFDIEKHWQEQILKTFMGVLLAFTILLLVPMLSFVLVSTIKDVKKSSLNITLC